MINIKKEYRTRDGREVRIYATDGVGIWPVAGASLEDNGWVNQLWSSGGSFTGGKFLHRTDLIEVKPRIQRTFWVNVYPQHPDMRMIMHQTKQIADRRAFPERIACVEVKIDVPQGEGL